MSVRGRPCPRPRSQLSEDHEGSPSERPVGGPPEGSGPEPGPRRAGGALATTWLGNTTFRGCVRRPGHGGGVLPALRRGRPGDPEVTCVSAGRSTEDVDDSVDDRRRVVNQLERIPEPRARAGGCGASRGGWVRMVAVRAPWETLGYDIWPTGACAVAGSAEGHAACPFLETGIRRDFAPACTPVGPSHRIGITDATDAGVRRKGPLSCPCATQIVRDPTGAVTGRARSVPVKRSSIFSPGQGWSSAKRSRNSPMST
jgi:hypothetical protein